jgi:GNAT superfamily N-acetyltransferase
VLGTVDVDREAYASCNKTYIPSPELVMSWFHANPNIYTILKDIDSGEVVGYINAMPIRDDFASTIRSGTFDESSIDGAALLRYGAPPSYHLYICSVAVRPSYRSGAALLSLLREFARRTNARLRAGDQLQNIYVDAVTDAGGKMCLDFDMQPVATTSRGSVVYSANARALISRYFDRLTSNDSEQHSQ